MPIDAANLALRYAMRKADLSPPLGYPGGACQVIDRIEDKILNPRTREKLIRKVEQGEDLDKAEEKAIYKDDHPERGSAGTQFKWIALSPHAQYRMDLRKVSVPEVLLVLGDFHKEFSKEKSRDSRRYQSWVLDFRQGEKIRWEEGGIRVVFIPYMTPRGDTGAVVVSVVRPGLSKEVVDAEDCEGFEGWSKEYPASIFASIKKMADLSPPLGFPGGPCHLINRIEEEVNNPRLRDLLVDQVEGGYALSNSQASKVYELEAERGPGGKFKQILITSHAQYRMDQRGITVTELRLALTAFQKAWNDGKSRKDPIVRSWESDMSYGEPIRWTDPKLHLTLVFTVAGGVVNLVTTFWEGQPDPRPVNEMSCRVAARHLEAGQKEWLSWMVQPFDVIWKHHRDFIYGPVDDAVDAIIKELAPQLVKAIGEEEIEEGVGEFTEGAERGRWDAQSNLYRDVRPDWTEDFREGYEWGFTNADTFKGNSLPSPIRKKVVYENLQYFRKRITEEVVERALHKAWEAVSPAHTLKAIITAVKKHGWKLGLGFALFELFEHMLLPTILITLTGHEELAVTGALPIGEVVYAIIFRILGRVPAEVNAADPDGHLDWYEDQFGPVRIAATSGGDCYEANGRQFMSMAPGNPQLKLVHGEVTGQGPLQGVNYGHAWVEDGSTVLDFSNGRTLRLPKVVFYALGNIERNDNFHVYGWKNFQSRILQNENWGPWDLKTSTGL